MVDTSKAFKQEVLKSVWLSTFMRDNGNARLQNLPYECMSLFWLFFLYANEVEIRFQWKFLHSRIFRILEC